MSGSERAGSVDGAMSAYSSKLTVFDEVLESGDTVRVSLTPDRMKTFDVSSLFNAFTTLVPYAYVLMPAIRCR